MENIIYNELIARGFNVDVGIIERLIIHNLKCIKSADIELIP